eukprot:6193838-Pleurochrysis_carterae.AAC.4
MQILSVCRHHGQSSRLSAQVLCAQAHATAHVHRSSLRAAAPPAPGLRRRAHPAVRRPAAWTPSFRCPNRRVPVVSRRRLG